MKIIVDNFKSKSFIKDKIILCFSIRANEYSRYRDMSKTMQIVKALEENGYMQNNEKNVSWSFAENKGIISIDSAYRYPQDAYDYVISLNEK